MKPLLFLLWAACGSDAVSTTQALHRGGHEAVLTQSAPIDGGIIMGTAAATSWGALHAKSQHPRLTKMLVVAAIAAHETAAAWNWHLVMAQDGRIRR